MYKTWIIAMVTCYILSDCFTRWPLTSHTLLTLRSMQIFLVWLPPPPPKKRLVFNKMGIMFTSLLTGVNSVLYTWYLSKKTSESGTCIILSPFFKDILILSWDRYLILISWIDSRLTTNNLCNPDQLVESQIYCLNLHVYIFGTCKSSLLASPRLIYQRHLPLKTKHCMQGTWLTGQRS